MLKRTSTKRTGRLVTRAEPFVLKKKININTLSHTLSHTVSHTLSHTVSHIGADASVVTS